MKTTAVRTLSLAASLTALSLLSACGANPTPASSAKPAQAQSQPEGGVISGAIHKAMGEAGKEIAEGNITISDHANGAKHAEITPQGDLLIDDKAVDVTPEQRALLLEYRGHVVEVATAGMHIGLQSADLATKALSESVKGIFSGKTDDIEKRVEAEADKVRASAVELCSHLPGMLASQQKLAAALPAFKPYATMDQNDVDECHKEADTHAQAAGDAAAEAAKTTRQ